MFRAKGALTPRAVELAYAEQNPPPPRSGKKKQKIRPNKNSREAKLSYGEAPADALPEVVATTVQGEPTSHLPQGQVPPESPSGIPLYESKDDAPSSTTHIDDNALSNSTPKSNTLPSADNATPVEADLSPDGLYCPECYVPLRPDPKPEKLYIFLHALRYTTASLGSFETPLPEWATKGYTWG